MAKKAVKQLTDDEKAELARLTAEEAAAAEGTGDSPEAEEAAAVEEVKSGPRIRYEANGEVVAMESDDSGAVLTDPIRERRLLIAGNNYEHVSDYKQDVGDGKFEIVWVYRRM